MAETDDRDIRDSTSTYDYGCHFTEVKDDVMTACPASSKAGDRLYAHRMRRDAWTTWWCRWHHPEPSRVRLLDTEMPIRRPA